MFKYTDNDKDITLSEFKCFIEAINVDFTPSLLERIDVCDYYKKLTSFATIITCREKGHIIGFCAMYNNDYKNKIGYITLVGVIKEFRHKGIASNLLSCAKRIAKANGMNKIYIHTNNPIAKFCYLSVGFSIIEETYLEDYQLIRYLLEINI